MSIIGAYNGATVYSVPSDSSPHVTAPSSIEWDPHEVVSANTSPFTGQTQTYDWQSSWWEGMVSFPPMNRLSADAWAAFILACRGPYNMFLIGDPRAALPKGSALGSPVVNGGGQTGYQLSLRGWVPNQAAVLLPGDFIQVGMPNARLYKVTAPAYADNTGASVLSIWPNLRDLPSDNLPIVTRNCKGLFRLAASEGNKWSTNVGSYGVTGLKIREAI